jgi:uncharacterized protein Yka (UPF0111/DUF47 family)
MFSLQMLLSGSDKFFDLLESSADQACRSAEALSGLLKNAHSERILDDFVQTRRKDKQITEEIAQLLCKTFVTPIEREDIEALSSALYKIPKTLEKFSERLLICLPHVRMEDFEKQTRLLEQATVVVSSMVKALRKKPQLESVKEQNERLQYLEGEGDKMMLVLLKELYSGKHEPMQVIVLRHLYELLEKVIDRCRDAGNIVFHIVLKNS